MGDWKSIWTINTCVTYPSKALLQNQFVRNGREPANPGIPGKKTEVLRPTCFAHNATAANATANII